MNKLWSFKAAVRQLAATGLWARDGHKLKIVRTQSAQHCTGTVLPDLQAWIHYCIHVPPAILGSVGSDLRHGDVIHCAHVIAAAFYSVLSRCKLVLESWIKKGRRYRNDAEEDSGIFICANSQLSVCWSCYGYTPAAHGQVVATALPPASGLETCRGCKYPTTMHITCEHWLYTGRCRPDVGQYCK